MKFGDKIIFNTAYSEGATKRYEEIKENQEYKRVVKIKKLNETLEGIVIGEVSKFDGIYFVNDKYVSVSLYDEHNEYDPPSFRPTKRVDFWKVATEMNVDFLVPKEYVEEFRIAIPKDYDFIGFRGDLDDLI